MTDFKIVLKQQRRLWRGKGSETEEMSLFDTSPVSAASERGRRTAPLAERMRPLTLEEFVGQEHLLAAGKPLRLAIEKDDPTSMIFWEDSG
jgi:putative ATPase